MFSKKTTYRFCASLAFLATPAFCTVVTFNDSAAWLAATTGVSTPIDFEGLALTPSSQTDYNNSTGLVINSVDFVGVTGPSTWQLHVKNPTAGQQYYDYGSKSIVWWPSYDGTGFMPYLEVTLPHDVSAVSLNVMTGGPGNTFSAGLNSPTFLYTSTTTSGWPTETFFGLTSDTPFNTFYLQVSGQYVTPFIDNFSYGSINTAQQDPPPADTPEAATFLMISIGLIWMGKSRKRSGSESAA